MDTNTLGVLNSVLKKKKTKTENKKQGQTAFKILYGKEYYYVLFWLFSFRSFFFFFFFWYVCVVFYCLEYDSL